MNDFISKFTAGMSSKRKITLGIGIGAIIFLTVALAYWALSDSYGILFTDLDPVDAGNIVTELERQKIPYQLDESGTTIRVKESKVHETRLKLMSHGIILNGAVGYEIFDKSDFGMTEYAQKINYQRALQGELSRTIDSIRGIKHARVQLVLPESSIFKHDKSESKASVSLVLDDGVQLTAEQVLGIQGLVAASVPDLVSSKITITDQHGKTISRNLDSNSELPLIGGQLEIKKQIEDYFTRKIVSVLDRTFGPGKAIISVDVTLNLDHVKTSEESVVPVDGESGDVGAVVRRKSTQQMQVIASTKTNEQKEPYQVQETKPGTATSEIEYVFGRKIEEVVSTPGGIRRISVGVIVPADLPNDELVKVRDVVSMAAGLNLKRGDGIAVHAVHYLPSPTSSSIVKLQEGATAGTSAEKNNPMINFRMAVVLPEFIRDYISPSVFMYLFLGFVLALAMTIYVLRRRKVSNETKSELPLSEEQRRELLDDIRRWVDAKVDSHGLGAQK